MTCANRERTGNIISLPIAVCTLHIAAYKYPSPPPGEAFFEPQKIWLFVPALVAAARAARTVDVATPVLPVRRGVEAVTTAVVTVLVVHG